MIHTYQTFSFYKLRFWSCADWVILEQYDIFTIACTFCNSCVAIKFITWSSESYATQHWTHFFCCIYLLQNLCNVWILFLLHLNHVPHQSNIWYEHVYLFQTLLEIFLYFHVEYLDIKVTFHHFLDLWSHAVQIKLVLPSAYSLSSI